MISRLQLFAALGGVLAGSLAFGIVRPDHLRQPREGVPVPEPAPTVLPSRAEPSSTEEPAPPPAAPTESRPKPEPTRPPEPQPVPADWPPMPPCRPCEREAEAATFKEDAERLKAGPHRLERVAGCSVDDAMLSGRLFDHPEREQFLREAQTAARFYWCAAHQTGGRAKAVSALKILRENVGESSAPGRKISVLLSRLGSP